MKSTALASQQETLSMTGKPAQPNFDMLINLRLHEIEALEESLNRIIANSFDEAGHSNCTA